MDRVVKIDGKNAVPVYKPGEYRPDGTLVLDFSKDVVSEPLIRLDGSRVEDTKGPVSIIKHDEISEKIADEWDEFNGDTGGSGPIVVLGLGLVVVLGTISTMVWWFW